MYSYASLMSNYENLVKRLKSGENLSKLESEIGRGCGHCLDVMEMSMDMSQPLNLKKDTEAFIAPIMLAVYQFYNKEKSPAECRSIVAEKFSFYLLFETCNVFEAAGYHPEMVLKGSTLHVSIKDDTGKEQGVIDVCGAVQRFVKNNLKFDTKQKAMTVVEPNALISNIVKQFF